MEARITIHQVHIHRGASDEELAGRFNRLERLIMATNAEFQEGFERVDAATTAIGALITSLVAKIAAGGMSADEEAAALDKLRASAGALEAMAQSPTDPVPVPVPEPEVPPVP
jgi:hypothetical protein